MEEQTEKLKTYIVRDLASYVWTTVSETCSSKTRQLVFEERKMDLFGVGY